MNVETIRQAIHDAVSAADQRGVRVEVTVEHSWFGIVKHRIIARTEQRTGLGTVNSPSRFDCMKKLRENPNMPYFLLLASDALAPKSVKDWAARLSLLVPGSQKAAEAFEVAARMEAWQANNGKKAPD